MRRSRATRSWPRLRDRAPRPTAGCRRRSRIPTRSTSPPGARPSSTSSTTTWRWARARCGACGERPTVLKRFLDGAVGEPFFQKRVPEKRPDWLETVTGHLPERRSRRRALPRRRRPHRLGGEPRLPRPQPLAGASSRRRSPRRAAGRPRPAAGRAVRPVRDVRRGGPRGPRGARARRVPEDRPARAASTSTSGSSRGGTSPRSAAPRSLSPARWSGAMPTIATTKWWKEERGDRVFIDYNQNARDRTVASAYSVRNNVEGRVSCPIEWDELPDVEPGDLTHRHRSRALRVDRRSHRRRWTTSRTRSSRSSTSRPATTSRRSR